MKIDTLKMRNFRAFVDVDIELNGDSAIFFGINGAGKTTVLDGVSILLSRYTARISPSGTRKSIEETDITYGRQRVELDIKLVNDGSSVEWGLMRERRQKRILITHLDQLKRVTDCHLETLSQGASARLPVMAYYPVHRAVLDIPLRIRTRHEFGQSATYEKSLISGADFRLFFEWFRNQEDLENQIRAREDGGYVDPQLDAVRRAIYSFMPGFSDLKVSRSPLRMVISKGERRIQVGQLSDGEKCMMALVGDLARRLAIANPGQENPLLGDGIVLIDEIELHLHPTWQRSVIPKLRSTFPNIQFLITTHSPQVLGEAVGMKLVQLYSDDDGSTRLQLLPDTLFGLDSNRILEDYMNSSDRNPEVKQKLETLFDILMSDRWIEARALLDDLAQEVGQSDPELARAEAIFRRKQIIGR
ncbi:MAG: AAA family ATPase [Alicyclobacillus sp.]|nr:AAA family ATPase [Alicyclobacillus sp.]